MRRLLIVEDDAAAGFGMMQFFSAKGYRVDLANSLEQALPLVRRRKYAAVFTDWALSPGGSEGETVVQAVRARLPDILVVVLAGAANQELEQRALAAGANRVFAKPVGLDSLAALLPDPRTEKRATRARRAGKKPQLDQ
jgi:DNA-binding NtrC family response regulator